LKEKALMMNSCQFGNKSLNFLVHARKLAFRTGTIREYSVSRTVSSSPFGSVSSASRPRSTWNEFAFQNDATTKTLQKLEMLRDAVPMMARVASPPSDASFERRAYEIDLKDVAKSKEQFDKIIVLVKHGEDESQLLEYATTQQSRNDDDVLHYDDPYLTGRGCGQALDISRTALDAEIVPEMILVSPLSRVVQTALLSFPHYSPASVRVTPWICHPGLVSVQSTMRVPFDQMKGPGRSFPGIDYSLCYKENEDPPLRQGGPTSCQKSQDRLLDGFLQWLESRPERLVVGTTPFVLSHCFVCFYGRLTYLLTICCLKFQSQPSRNGLKRSMGTP
jgi:hypothetical protein